MGPNRQLRWVIPVLLFLLFSTFFLLHTKDGESHIAPWVALPSAMDEQSQNYSTPGFLVDTVGCRMPAMDAFDPSIRKYIKKVKDIPCSAAPPFILSNLTSIYINPEALALSGGQKEEFYCCYIQMWRKVQKETVRNVDADLDISFSKKCIRFDGGAKIPHQFVKVKCFHNTSLFYEDYHAFIIPKKPRNIKKPSVLLIGVDAMSRLNLERQMPQTIDFVRTNDAFELQGYNKVGDNTFPNIVPVLTGRHVEEITQDCWKTDDDYFDNCTFLWNLFEANGYQTGFGEDSCWMGIFQYQKNGFLRQPVDNYATTLIAQAEEDIGHTKVMNAKLCVGPRPVSEMLLNFAEKFAVNLTWSQVPFYGFFWGGSLTHDFLNVQPKTDLLYLNLLQNLKRNGVFKNTIVIFMSDHGIRWGDIRETYQGRVEERQPFLHLFIPKWMREKYPTAMSFLRKNRNRLTSPFDLHETMKNLLSLSSLEQETLLRRARDKQLRRGMSLFLPVPETRTCADAGIPDNWCTCHTSQNVSVEDPKVAQAALTVVDYMNQMLFSYMQCAQLTLREVKSAQLEGSAKELKENTKKQMEDIVIVLETEPGRGLFEATVRHDLQEDTFAVLGYVSRINAYGDQSRCVGNFRMKLYCYCS